MNLTKKRREEVWTLMYKDSRKEQKESYKRNKDEALLCKNNMLAFEDYNLFIYGYGKILSLERKETEEFEGHDANIKGWNPLISNDEGLISNIAIKIHKPQGSDTFEIIRK